MEGRCVEGRRCAMGGEKGKERVKRSCGEVGDSLGAIRYA